ncbi:hypothetical protein E2C01_045850 [Portunus trituberculatus]|uniref:Uncharacterized protein n=1 Tax=Portunus trituberculatus TaxID=210409 RepID=A0A5B7FZC8_PORTR|nr:hypothetical protein [Portunus trituberculatus]
MWSPDVEQMLELVREKEHIWDPRNELYSRATTSSTSSLEEDILKKVKTPVVILIVIWEIETNPYSDVHKPPHILPSSNALVCVTHGCLYRTVLVGQVT